jgi:hypothetical protein
MGAHVSLSPDKLPPILGFGHLHSAIMHESLEAGRILMVARQKICVVSSLVTTLTVDSPLHQLACSVGTASQED